MSGLYQSADAAIPVTTATEMEEILFGNAKSCEQLVRVLCAETMFIQMVVAVKLKYFGEETTVTLTKLCCRLQGVLMSAQRTALQGGASVHLPSLLSSSGGGSSSSSRDGRHALGCARAVPAAAAVAAAAAAAAVHSWHVFCSQYAGLRAEQ